MKFLTKFLILGELAKIYGRSEPYLRSTKQSHVRLHSSHDTPQFECKVTETAGSSIPNGIPTLHCEIDPSDPHQGDSVFLLRGATRNFFNGIDLSLGNTRISVPLKVVNQETDEILFDDTTMHQINIIDDSSKKRILSDASATGTKYVLVIRVTGWSNGEKQELIHSKEDLMNDIFHWNNSNLKTIYKSCSASQLKIKPARTQEEEIAHPVNGVIEAHIPTNKNICDMSFYQVGNLAFKSDSVSRFLSNPDNKVTHKMIVLPDCVDFQGGAAWAQVAGTKTWFKSDTVAFPATQVHEFGHNLGMKHSGNSTVGGALSHYSDGSGYMSNVMAWDKEGNQMCFNAAKMWYTGWYSYHHTSIKPSTAENTFDLIALDDLKEDRPIENPATSILELEAEGNSTNLYCVFNRAKGINLEVVSDRNKVVIIEQEGPQKTSDWKGAIDSQNILYVQEDWGELGNTLVIEHVHTSYGTIDYARIKVYVIPPDGEMSPAGFEYPEETEQCDDVAGWHDIDGTTFNCAWYAKANNCENFGHGYENKGHTANTACCACQIAEPIFDPFVDTLAGTGDDNGNDTTGTLLSTATVLCEDDIEWYDQQGPTYNCEWYGEDINRCHILGNGYRNFGKTAQEACCDACQQ